MKPLLRISILLALSTAAVASMSQAVTGLWHGYIVVDKSTLPKPSNADQQKIMLQKVQAMDAAIAKAKITLTLSADKTYKMSAENVPGTTSIQTSSGTYTQAGTVITLHPKLSNGKPATGSDAKNQPINITNGGKNLAIAIPNAGMVKIAIVFHR